MADRLPSLNEPTVGTTASRYLLPCRVCSSVTGCWLDFSCAGLSSLIALALLGTLILVPVGLIED